MSIPFYLAILLLSILAQVSKPVKRASTNSKSTTNLVKKCIAFFLISDIIILGYYILTKTILLKKGEISLTSGSIVKHLYKFAWPCILGRILQNLYTLIDSVIVGQAVDTGALATVGVASSIISLFTETVIGLVGGFAVTAGKKYGSTDEEGVKKVFAVSLRITIVVGGAITILGIILSRTMLKWLQTPSDIIDSANVYLTLMFAGIITSVFYNFLCEMLRALGFSKEPLIILVISSLLHIALIFLFVFGFNYAVVGAAFSTILSQAFSVILCIIFIKKKVPQYRIKLEDLKPDKKIFRECIHIGIPMAATNFVVTFGVIILSFITNGIGIQYVAAYTCASRIGYIVTTPIFGFASAVSVFVAQNLGAGKIDRIKNGVKMSNVIVTIINIVLFIIMWFITKPLLEWFLIGDKVAVDAGVMYMRTRCTAMFILTFAAIYKTTLNALGKPMFPTISGFAEIAVRYIFPIITSAHLGFACVPLTDAVTWLMLALVLSVAYFFEFSKISKCFKKRSNSMKNSVFNM